MKPNSMPTGTKMFATMTTERRRAAGRKAAAEPEAATPWG